MPDPVVASLPTSSVPTQTANTAKAQPSSFHTILSELNPLQYLPVIGTIYRAVTGDTIPEAVRSIGSFVVSGLMGGPIGLATNAAMQVLERITGIDPEKIGQEALAGLGVGQGAGSPAVANATASDAGSTAADFAGWSPTQLKAYGVTTAADGIMTRGAVEGADVLNGLELVRHGTASLLASVQVDVRRVAFVGAMPTTADSSATADPAHKSVIAKLIGYVVISFLVS